MAHTNSTPNYNLPQFLPTDKPAWLVDVNPAYASIDTAIKNASDAAGAAQGDATQALSDAAGAQATATQANSKADGAIASLAEKFLDTATYATGEYVIFNNILYVCTEPVTTPGPWTGSVNWARASVDSIATELNSDINNLESRTGSNIAVSDSDPTTIANALSYSSQSVSVPTYGGTLECRKFGRIVTITLWGLGSTSLYLEGSKLILSGIIPQAYRPVSWEYVLGTLIGAESGSTSALYTLKENGNVEVYAYSNIGSGRFTITYIV